MARTFSRWSGGIRIGGDFFDRRGGVAALGEGERAPRGVVDRIGELRNPGLDLAAIDPGVVAFFEDCAGLELLVRSHWRFPFSIGWRLTRFVMRWVRQFALPPPRTDARILCRVVPLDPARDGRPNARAVIRSYADSGEVM